MGSSVLGDGRRSLGASPAVVACANVVALMRGTGFQVTAQCNLSPGVYSPPRRLNHSSGLARNHHMGPRSDGFGFWTRR